MKIGIIFFNKALSPKVGENFEIKHCKDSKYPKRIGIDLNGIMSYGIVSQDLLSQLNGGVMSSDEVYDSLDFANDEINGVVEEVQEVTTANGQQNLVVVLNVVTTPKVTATASAKATKDSKFHLAFRGSMTEFPDLKDAIADANGGNLQQEFSVGRLKGKIALFYGANPIGVITNEDKEFVKRFKSFDDNAKVKAEFEKYKMGVFNITVESDELKVDFSHVLDDIKDYALSTGVTEDEFEMYTKIMLEIYEIPAKLARLIISSWKPVKQEYIDRYIFLDKIASKDSKGNVHPLYIDEFENVKRLAAYLISGRSNICLKGEASVGKNVLIETLAGLFRKPLLRESLSGGSDESILLGDKNINTDGTIGFDPSQLIKAAEDGCWVILDEINTVQAQHLTELHSILEPGTRNINVSGYKYVKADNDFRILATMNPADTGDYLSADEMNAATASRFTTIEITSNVKVQDVLKNACPEALDDEINKVAKLYKSVKAMKDGGTELSSGFLALRAYISILDDPISNEFVSLKDRCIDHIVNANPNDSTQCQAIKQTINDTIN